jgi:Nuclease-related domain
MRAEAEARALQRDEISANRGLIVQLLVGMSVLCGLDVAIMGLWKGSNLAWFAAGGGVVAVAWVISAAVETVQIRRWRDGALGERFTASAIRRRRGDGWRIVDHIELDGWDVDHVAAGPAGVFAIETKWTNEPWRFEHGKFTNQFARKAIDQSKRGADRIKAMLRANYELHVDVTPVLVIWGSGRPPIDEPVLLDGVFVVPGPLVREWLLTLPTVADVRQQDDVIDALEHIVALRDELDAVRAAERRQRRSTPHDAQVAVTAGG